MSDFSVRVARTLQIGRVVSRQNSYHHTTSISNQAREKSPHLVSLTLKLPNFVEPIVCKVEPGPWPWLMRVVDSRDSAGMRPACVFGFVRSQSNATALFQRREFQV